MTIRANIKTTEIIEHIKSSFKYNNFTDEQLIGMIVLRNASILCPCSKTHLRNNTIDSIMPLFLDSEDIKEKINQSIDDLLIIGELNERDDVLEDEYGENKNWVFCSPPIFIKRKSGTIVILGLYPSYSSIRLKDDVRKKITYKNLISVIEPSEENEIIAEELKKAGLTELKESVWCKLPKIMTWKEFIEKRINELDQQSDNVYIDEYEVFLKDPTVRHDKRYKNKEYAIKHEITGNYVIRRPTKYSGKIWSFANINNGEVKKIKDLPISSNMRGCDDAWQIQMALDAKNETPQQYKLVDIDDKTRLEFKSPLPLWAERKLMLMGEKEEAWLTYNIPRSEIIAEEKFLREYLWLTKKND